MSSPPLSVAALAARTFSSPRHKTRRGPLTAFDDLVHGWPQIGLVWRAQMEAFAADGWRCIAPDMRGYGGSSAPTASEAYALSEIVQDMAELHDYWEGSRRSGLATTGAALSLERWPRMSPSGAAVWC